MTKNKDSRRTLVPFNPYFFEEQKKEGAQFGMKETFHKIYQTNHWSSGMSVSGAGSEQAQTEYLLIKLRSLVKELNVKHLLDVPCGDFNWIKHLQIPGLLYTGGDIVQEITLKNKSKYGSVKRKFITVDITSGRLSDADLLLCRDCFVHLSFNDISRALLNIKRHKITYLLTTTFPDCKINEDITTGDWRPINLMLPPFNFPEPVYLINEKCTEGDGAFRDKSLGLWKTDQL
jgi:hypothetical protein